MQPNEYVSAADTDKKKFFITIEETVAETFEIYAKNINSAIEIAVNKYKTGDIVLTPGDLMCKKIKANDLLNDIETEWNEF